MVVQFDMSPLRVGSQTIPLKRGLKYYYSITQFIIFPQLILSFAFLGGVNPRATDTQI